MLGMSRRLGIRIGPRGLQIPLEVLEARLAALVPGGALKVSARGGGLRIEGAVEALRAPLRFGVTLHHAQAHGAVGDVAIRLSELHLETSDDAPGPLAAAVREGRIDVAAPASLLRAQLFLPEGITPEGDDLIVLSIPRLVSNARGPIAEAASRAALGTLDLTLRVDAGADALVIRPRALPRGGLPALGALLTLLLEAPRAIAHASQPSRALRRASSQERPR